MPAKHVQITKIGIIRNVYAIGGYSEFREFVEHVTLTQLIMELIASVT
jgi:hypothetical protein